MKKILLPLVLGGMLISCSRDNDNPVAEVPILPTKIEWKVSKGNYYDAAINFTYNGDKIKESILKVNYNFSETRTLNERLVYHYTGDKITSIDYYTDLMKGGDFVKRIINFNYNNDGTLKGISPDIYTIQNGNLVEFKETGRKYNYTYDDKNGPFKNVKGLEEIAPVLYTYFYSIGFEHSFEYFRAFKNNMTSSIETYDKYGVGDRKTYTYEYNSKGYPIKSIELNENTQSVIEFVKTYTYNK